VGGCEKFTTDSGGGNKTVVSQGHSLCCMSNMTLDDLRRTITQKLLQTTATSVYYSDNTKDLTTDASHNEVERTQ